MSGISYERVESASLQNNGDTAYATGKQAAESANLNTAVAGSPTRQIVGRPTIYIGARFDTASDSATLIAVLRDREGNYVAHHEFVLTADAALVSKAADNRFIAPHQTLDALGADRYDIRVHVASAADFDIFAWEA